MTRQCCPCWAEVSLHDGHCCFRDYPPEPYNGPTLCGHDTEGREVMAAYKRSKAEPCQECADPIDDGECPHGRPLCDTCRLSGCWPCCNDYWDDYDDAIFDGLRDVARDREVGE